MVSGLPCPNTTLWGEIVRRGNANRVAKLDDTMEQVAPVSRRIDAEWPAIWPRNIGTRNGGADVDGAADVVGTGAGTAGAVVGDKFEAAFGSSNADCMEWM